MSATSMGTMSTGAAVERARITRVLPPLDDATSARADAGDHGAQAAGSGATRRQMSGATASQPRAGQPRTGLAARPAGQMLLSVWLSDGDYLEVWSDRVVAPGQTYALDEWFQAKVVLDPRAPLVVDRAMGIALRSHGGPWATYVPGRQEELRRLMLTIGRACVARGIEPPEVEAGMMAPPWAETGRPAQTGSLGRPGPTGALGRPAPRRTMPLAQDAAYQPMRAPVNSGRLAHDPRMAEPPMATPPLGNPRMGDPRLSGPRMADPRLTPAQPVRAAPTGRLGVPAEAPTAQPYARVQPREAVLSRTPPSRTTPPLRASAPGPASTPGAPGMAPGRSTPVVRRPLQRPPNSVRNTAPHEVPHADAYSTRRAPMDATPEDEGDFVAMAAYSHSDALLAAISHLSLLFCPGLLAGAVWVALRGDTPHVARHAREALLFQCAFYALALPVAALTLLATGGHGVSLGATIGLVALALLLVAGATCAGMAAVEALRGGDFSYLEIPRRVREPAAIA